MWRHSPPCPTRSASALACSAQPLPPHLLPQGFMPLNYPCFPTVDFSVLNEKSTPRSRRYLLVLALLFHIVCFLLLLTGCPKSSIAPVKVQTRLGQDNYLCFRGGGRNNFSGLVVRFSTNRQPRRIRGCPRLLPPNQTKSQTEIEAEGRDVQSETTNVIRVYPIPKRRSP